MRFGIVEGEPGIFPDPWARILRFVAKILRAPFRRGHRSDGTGDE